MRLFEFFCLMPKLDAVLLVFEVGIVFDTIGLFEWANTGLMELLILFNDGMLVVLDIDGVEE